MLQRQKDRPKVEFNRLLKAHQHLKSPLTHQLFQNGAEELIIQGPGLWSGGKLGQNPPCKVTDPHLHLGVLQQAQDVFKQVLIQQVRLQLFNLCYVVLQHSETNA